MSNFVNLLDIIYPVGSIYQSMSATSPVDFIGSTWTKIKTFLYGADTAGTTGGEATHTLTVDEIPSHRHNVSINLQHSDGPVVNEESLTSGLQQGGRRRYGEITIDDDCWGKLITTCRPTQPASSGTEQLKLFKGNLYIL